MQAKNSSPITLLILQMREDILQVKQYLNNPKAQFPKTGEEVSRSLKDDHAQVHFSKQVQEPMLKEALSVLSKHTTDWFQFPKFFGMGADTKLRHFFWRSVLRVLGLEVESRSFSDSCVPPFKFPSASKKAQAIYNDLCESAMRLKSVELLLTYCLNQGLVLQREDYINQSTAIAWFTEFEILAVVSTEEAGLRKWARQWDIFSEPLLKEIRIVANTSSPKLVNLDTEPILYMWFAKYLFVLPVNNVIAERQFNIASLVLQPNMSELSKQATQCFVENVIHNSDDHQELLRSLREDNPNQTSKIRIAEKVRDHTRKQMNAYASKITQPLFSEASRNAKKLQKKENSTVGPLTAKDLYPSKFLASPVKVHSDEVISKEKRRGCISSSAVDLHTKKGQSPGHRQTENLPPNCK